MRASTQNTIRRTRASCKASTFFSDEYRLCGWIDLFDTKRRLLTERKKYDGYVFSCTRTVFACAKWATRSRSYTCIRTTTTKPIPFRYRKTVRKGKKSFERSIVTCKTFRLIPLCLLRASKNARIAFTTTFTTSRSRPKPKTEVSK